MNLNDKITTLLQREGCGIIGFADLRGFSKETRQNFDYGIVIALSYAKEDMLDNNIGRPQKYFTKYTAMNEQLPKLATLTAGFLVSGGYKAFAKISSTVVQDEDYRTILPYKSVATQAGIGWIGKCALLVTKKVGSALRLIVVLTNAPLECGKPVIKSECPPDCIICAGVCPGKAPLGGLWEAGMDRDTFFNANACRSTARDRAKSTLGIDETVCGLCISNCPFTKWGLGYR